MNERSPCSCAMRCGPHTREFHSLAGRVGGRNQPREAKVRGGRNQPREAKVRGWRKMQATWGKTDEARELRSRTMRKMLATWGKTEEAREVRSRNGRKMNATWGKTEEAREVRSHNMRKTQATWVKTDEARKASSRGGRISARTLSHKRPTWPEARLYGLVFGDPILSHGFTAQQDDGHGVYDGAWHEERIIAELDGGGHHLFRDRTADDARKDAARRADGFTVIRAPDENVLYLRILGVLG